MKKIKRADEEKVKLGEEKKSNLFSRLAERFNNPYAALIDKTFRPPVQTENLVQKTVIVKAKEIVATREQWLKKRGFKGDSEDNDLAKQVFLMCQKGNTIKGSDFIRFLIEIGVALPVTTIKQSLSHVFHTKSIENHIISENDIVSLFKSNSFINNLLAKVFENTYKMIKSTNFGLSQDSFYDENNFSISTSNMERLIKNWWEEMDTYKRNQIHLNEVSEFLLKKGIVADQTEGRKFLGKLFKQRVFIDYNQFLLIFSSTLIKWGLKIICKKLKNETNKEGFFSKEYSLTLLKKKLILAGVHYAVSEFSTEEGVAAIKNIEKYKENTENPVPKVTFEEFCKEWKFTTGQEINKQKKISFKRAETPQPLLSIFNSFDSIDCNNKNAEENKPKILFSGKEKNTILGDYILDGNSKWRHSISPNFSPYHVGDGELRKRQKTDSFMEFQRICKHVN